MHPLAVVAGPLGGALLPAGPEESAPRQNPSQQKRRQRVEPRRYPRARQRRHAEPVYSAWWGGRLPAKPVVGTFFRLTQGPEATESDFKSNKERGHRPRGREEWDEEEFRAVSGYSHPRDAADALRRFPQTGRYAARLLVVRGAPITGQWRPTRHRSHWNLWGAPADLLGAVREEGLTAEQLDALPPPR